MRGKSVFYSLLRPVGMITIVSGLLFFLLLGIRLDLFRHTQPLTETKVSILAAKESWMNIFQKGQRIGYAHRRLSPRPGGYDLLDTTRIRINTMGMVQDVNVRTIGSLRSDMSLDSFSFELQSSLFHFKIRGKREGNILLLFTGEEELEIPVKEGLFLTSGTLDAAFNADLKVDQSQRFLIFDPATRGQRPVHITMKGHEQLEIMGRRHNTKKVQIDFMGVSQFAWIGEDGSILQEDGLLGIRLQRTTKRDAMNGLPLSSSPDLTEMVSILPKGGISRPLERKRLQLKITGMTDSILLDGGRQRLEDGILTIDREDPSAILQPNTQTPMDHLDPTALIQSDHPVIRQQVAKIISQEDPPALRAEKIMRWIYKNIEKRPVLSVPDALETLENRMGDCNEHAVLMAAMARAAGIPSQIEAGLVLLKGRFYYHAWNALFLDRWITADALMGQLPADVTHIRLVRGEAEHQIDLIGVIGKITIEILEPPL